jgi:hypothetical protein
VIIPFAEEDYSRKPRINMVRIRRFGLPKVLIDNSAAVEVLVKKAKWFTTKRARRIIGQQCFFYM